MPTRLIQSASVVAVVAVVVAVVQKMVQHWKVRISNKKAQPRLITLQPPRPLRRLSLQPMLHTKHLRTVHLPLLPEQAAHWPGPPMPSMPLGTQVAALTCALRSLCDGSAPGSGDERIGGGSLN